MTWCLLTGKTANHYQTVFAHIKESSEKLTVNQLEPMMLICDFEHSLKMDVKEELPGIQIGGCYFHFCQSASGVMCKI